MIHTVIGILILFLLTPLTNLRAGTNWVYFPIPTEGTNEVVVTNTIVTGGGSPVTNYTYTTSSVPIFITTNHLAELFNAMNQRRNALELSPLSFYHTVSDFVITTNDMGSWTNYTASYTNTTYTNDWTKEAQSLGVMRQGLSYRKEGVMARLIEGILDGDGADSMVQRMTHIQSQKPAWVDWEYFNSDGYFTNAPEFAGSLSNTTTFWSFDRVETVVSNSIVRDAGTLATEVLIQVGVNTNVSYEYYTYSPSGGDDFFTENSGDIAAMGFEVSAKLKEVVILSNSTWRIEGFWGGSGSPSTSNVVKLTYARVSDTIGTTNITIDYSSPVIIEGPTNDPIYVIDDPEVVSGNWVIGDQLKISLDEFPDYYNTARNAGPYLSANVLNAMYLVLDHCTATVYHRQSIGSGLTYYLDDGITNDFFRAGQDSSNSWAEAISYWETNTALNTSNRVLNFGYAANYGYWDQSIDQEWRAYTDHREWGLRQTGIPTNPHLAMLVGWVTNFTDTGLGTSYKMNILDDLGSAPSGLSWEAGKWCVAMTNWTETTSSTQQFYHSFGYPTNTWASDPQTPSNSLSVRGWTMADAAWPGEVEGAPANNDRDRLILIFDKSTNWVGTERSPY